MKIYRQAKIPALFTKIQYLHLQAPSFVDCKEDFWLIDNLQKIVTNLSEIE